MSDPSALSVTNLDPNQCLDQHIAAWAAEDQAPTSLSVKDLKMICRKEPRLAKFCISHQGDSRWWYSPHKQLALFETVRSLLLLHWAEAATKMFPEDRSDVAWAAFYSTLDQTSVTKLAKGLGCPSPLKNPTPTNGSTRFLEHLSEHIGNINGEALQNFARKTLVGLHQLLKNGTSPPDQALTGITQMYQLLEESGFPAQVLRTWENKSLAALQPIIAQASQEKWESSDSHQGLLKFSETLTCPIATSSFARQPILPETTRQAVVEFLDRVKIPSKSGFLRQLFTSERNPSLRARIATALGRESDLVERKKNVQTLLAAVDTRGSDIVQAAALRAYVILGEENTTDLLTSRVTKILGDIPRAGNELRQACLLALSDDGSEPALKMLQELAASTVLLAEEKKLAANLLFGSLPRHRDLPLPNGHKLSYFVTAKSDGPLRELDPQDPKSWSHPNIVPYFANRLTRQNLPEDEHREARRVLLWRARTNTWAREFVVFEPPTDQTVSSPQVVFAKAAPIEDFLSTAEPPWLMEKSVTMKDLNDAYVPWNEFYKTSRDQQHLQKELLIKVEVPQDQQGPMTNQAIYEAVSSIERYVNQTYEWNNDDADREVWIPTGISVQIYPWDGDLLRIKMAVL